MTSKCGPDDKEKGFAIWTGSQPLIAETAKTIVEKQIKEMQEDDVAVVAIALISGLRVQYRVLLN